MTENIDDTLELKSPIVPAAAFGDVAIGLEYTLTDFITDIHLATTYEDDEAISHAVTLLTTAHTLQAYLFSHLERLIQDKQLKEYEQATNIE